MDEISIQSLCYWEWRVQDKREIRQVQADINYFLKRIDSNIFDIGVRTSLKGIVVMLKKYKLELQKDLAKRYEYATNIFG